MVVWEKLFERGFEQLRFGEDCICQIKIITSWLNVIAMGGAQYFTGSCPYYSCKYSYSWMDKI